MNDMLENSNKSGEKSGEITSDFREKNLPELCKIITGKGNDFLKISANLEISVNTLRTYLSGNGVNKESEFRIVNFTIGYLQSKVKNQLKTINEILEKLN